ncbi:hypothetical protein PIIN_08008 [Serendipita indica DSM 11827]|uniref:Uncharacterized protein n=1 Tax=Serendipita indica (strain DSM 11827) TaxID=1109443 RepID=G4TRW1_SERID|nr:hypothetical protein PIIN_08008 [Serendipita indica DSM 11827]
MSEEFMTSIKLLPRSERAGWVRVSIIGVPTKSSLTFPFTSTMHNLKILYRAWTYILVQVCMEGAKSKNAVDIRHTLIQMALVEMKFRSKSPIVEKVWPVLKVNELFLCHHGARWTEEALEKGLWDKASAIRVRIHLEIAFGLDDEDCLEDPTACI